MMIIYSVLPNKSYSKKLLGYGYNKPIFAVGMFAAELIVMYVSVKALTGFDFPIMGSATLGIPSEMTANTVSISMNASGSFLWPFYFAIAVAVLCVAARMYHKKVAQPIAPAPTVVPPVIK
jgi:hypothetical protein